MKQDVPAAGFHSSSIRTFRAFEAIFNNFRYYTEMSCYMVSKAEPDRWICLQPGPKHNAIKDFELLFGRAQDRERYVEMNFQRLSGEKRALCARFSGFYDFFVPVLKKGECIAYVVSGIFLKSIPTRKGLEHQWELWTGKKPFPEDPNFKRFAATALNMPLLDGPQARAHRDLLEMAAALISGEGDPDSTVSRAMDMEFRTFTKWKLNTAWPGKALGLEMPPSDRVWPDKRLDEYDGIVTKMKRVPTVALALLLVDEPERSLDEVDAMIRQKRLEREGFFWAQRLGETVAFPLGDEGLVFLTSPKPGSNPTQAKLQLREKARSISERMGREFLTQALIGIGPILPEGEGLDFSCRRALLALQWAIHQGKNQLFYEEVESSEMNPRPEERPWPDAQDLAEAYLRDSKAEKTSALDRFIRAVIHHAAGRAELVRVHLISALSLCTTHLERKLLLPSGRLSGSLRDWISRLEKPRVTHELIGSFKEILGELVEYSRDPFAAEGSATVKDLKTYVTEHFRSSLTADGAARQMGFSRSSLQRYVRKWMGMGFNEYVRLVRLEEAKRMLRTSRFSVARIAQECGFSSSGYFIRTFKKNTRKTPLQFRNGPDGQ